MKKSALIGLILSVLIIMPVVSATITITEPKAAYSIKDVLDVNVALSPSSNTNGFLIMKFVCGADEAEIYRIPYFVSKGEQKLIPVSAGIEKFLIGDLRGDCFLRVSYGGEDMNSAMFKISDSVKMDIVIDGIVFDPGSPIKISGTATKENGELLNGFAEVKINGTNLEGSKEVIDGKFEFNLLIPAETPGDSYAVRVKAYDEDSLGEVANKGESVQFFTVAQVVKQAEIAMNSQTVVPGEEIVYTPILYDQVGSQVSEDVEVSIYNPSGELVEKKLSKSGESASIKTNYDYISGNWRISVKYNTKYSEKQFFISELQDVSFTLENETLNVKNTGNVPYNKAISVSIGGIDKAVDVELEVGESKSFRLVAPEGDYNIDVKKDSTQNESTNLGVIFLTGNAIGVQGSIGGISYIWIWVIVILILLALAFYFYKRMSRNRFFYGKQPGQGAMPSKIIGGMSSEISMGERQECSVVSLRLKNYNEIQKSEDALYTIDDALTKTKDKNAKVYSSLDYRIIVLCPKLTRIKENGITAVKLAKEVAEMINLYNKSHSPQIDFGIGINTGDLAVESKEGKIKFASLGNTIALAKKASEAANKEVLLSEPIYRKTTGRVKGEKSRSSGFWKLSRIVDRETHNDFINRFSNRQNKKE